MTIEARTSSTAHLGGARRRRTGLPAGELGARADHRDPADHRRRHLAPRGPGAAERDTGRDLAAAGWVMNAYFLLVVASVLIVGRLGDLLGHRRVFSAGIAIYGLGALASALAPGLTWLVAARALQGLGAAMVYGTSLALVAEALPGDPARAGGRRRHDVGERRQLPRRRVQRLRRRAAVVALGVLDPGAAGACSRWPRLRACRPVRRPSAPSTCSAGSTGAADCCCSVRSASGRSRSITSTRASRASGRARTTTCRCMPWRWSCCWRSPASSRSSRTRCCASRMLRDGRFAASVFANGVAHMSMLSAAS